MERETTFQSTKFILLFHTVTCRKYYFMLFSNKTNTFCYFSSTKLRLRGAHGILSYFGYVQNYITFNCQGTGMVKDAGRLTRIANDKKLGYCFFKMREPVT